MNDKQLDLKRICRCSEDETLEHVISLIVLTGLRINDILNIKLTDIKNKLLVIRDIETNRVMSFSIDNKLEKAINRILWHSKLQKINSLFLLTDNEGRQLTYKHIRNSWIKARNKAGYASSGIQLRDIRGDYWNNHNYNDLYT